MLVFPTVLPERWKRLQKQVSTFKECIGLPDPLPSRPVAAGTCRGALTAHQSIPGPQAGFCRRVDAQNASGACHEWNLRPQAKRLDRDLVELKHIHLWQLREDCCVGMRGPAEPRLGLFGGCNVQHSGCCAVSGSGS